MVSKRGVIRTLEAIIAVVILLIFIYLIMPKEIIEPPENPIEKYKDFIIKDMNYNGSLREKLMALNLDSYTHDCDKQCLEALCNSDCVAAVEDVDAIITKTLPSVYDFFFKMCDQPSCIADPTLIPSDKSVFMFDVFISSSASSGITNPIIVRVWAWNK